MRRRSRRGCRSAIAFPAGAPQVELVKATSPFGAVLAIAVPPDSTVRCAAAIALLVIGETDLTLILQAGRDRASRHTRCWRLRFRWRSHARSTRCSNAGPGHLRSHRDADRTAAGGAVTVTSRMARYCSPDSRCRSRPDWRAPTSMVRSSTKILVGVVALALVGIILAAAGRRTVEQFRRGHHHAARRARIAKAGSVIGEPDDGAARPTAPTRIMPEPNLLRRRSAAATLR